jgi:DNA-binding beta-propeller fold protein YncE
MVGPGGLAIGPDGSSYIADSGNNRIDVFSASGTFVRTFGKEATPVEGECHKDAGCEEKNTALAGVLKEPKDLVLDSAGHVFVADSGLNRIDVFASDGTFVRAFGKGVDPAGGDVCTAATECQKGASSGSDGALSSPAGIGIDSAGALYVTDTGNYRIDVFSPEGTYIRSIGNEIKASSSDSECKLLVLCPKEMEARKAGAMKLPSDVAVDAKGQVAVADPGNRRIDVFASDGTFVHAFGKNVNANILCSASGDCDTCTEATGCGAGTESSAAGGLASPSAIAVGNSGSLYVADAANHRINEFSFDGTFIRAFGEGVIDEAPAFQVCTVATDCKTGIPGTIPGAVSGPRGTAMDCRGAIYAVEAYTEDKNKPALARVERFGESETAPPPCPAPPPPPPPDPEGPAPTEPPVSLLALQSLPDAPHVVAKPKIKIELDQGTGTAILIVLVSDPGTLTVRGKGIHKVSRQTKRPGMVELLVASTGKTERKLKEAGKAKVKVFLTFKPDQGNSITQAAKVTLKLVHHL